MKPPGLEQLITASHLLTKIFGGWPSFHDAEIAELHFDRGEINEDTGTFEFPVLTVKIVLWNLTSRISTTGQLETENHTLAILRFTEVDNLSMAGFNYQNAIMGLEITSKEDGARSFHVSFDPAFGMECSFDCGSIEVLNAIPWNASKRPPRWLQKEDLSKVV